MTPWQFQVPAIFVVSGDLRRRDRTAAVGAVRTRPSRRRPAARGRLRPPRLREWPAQAHEDAAEHAGGAAAGEGARSARPATGLRQPDPVSEYARRQDRLPDLRAQPLAAGTDQGGDRAGPRPLRPPAHLCNLRASRRRAGVRGLSLHGLEHRDDRPPLRPPRPRQPRTRRLAAGRSRDRTGRGRCVDVATGPRKAAQSDRFQAPWEATTASGGRSVDGGTPNRRRVREEKELKSRNFTKPSNGLEPLTPSLP